MSCQSCGAKLDKKAQFCPSCGKPVAKKAGVSSPKKSPKIKINLGGLADKFKAVKIPNKKFVLIPSLVLVILGGFLLSKFLIPKLPFLTKKPLATYDNYPIWLLRDDKVAVYREMRVYPDSIEKKIVIKSLPGSDEKDVQIYEYIPKEIALSAANLEFSVKPEIIEDDPLIMWKYDPSKEGAVLTYKVKGSVAPTPVNRVPRFANSSSAFLKNFEENWPTFNENPVEMWEKLHDFSKTEMAKSAKEAMAGKTITVAKDITDVAAILATGTGILDAVNLVSELYSIGTTIYGEDTGQSFEDTNFWLLAGSIVNSGWENKDLIKASLNLGAQTLKAKQGADALAASQKFSELANKVDPKTGVTAAESMGLNLAGIIIDYAVINQVASTTKYVVFEMNEQAKMEYLSRNLITLWGKYEKGTLTEGDAKKIIELETLFFMAQQKELSVRKVYLKSQLGLLDSAISLIPIAGKYTAKSGLGNLEKTLASGANQLRWRVGAKGAIYGDSENKETGLAALQKKEIEAAKKAAAVQTEKEKITRVIQPDSPAYDVLKNTIKAKTAASPATLLTENDKPVATAPVAGQTGGQGKKVNFSVEMFPATLLGYAKGKTSTSPPTNDCFKSLGAAGYIYAEYGPAESLILVSISQFADSGKATGTASLGADCMTKAAASKDVTFQMVSKDPIAGYPTALMRDNTSILIGTFTTVDKYMFNISMLTADAQGGKEADHREAMRVILEAFTGGGTAQVSPTAQPATTATGCQAIDLSSGYKTYWLYDSTFPCNSYARSATASRFSVRCNDPVSRWREHYVKEIPIAGAASLRIKAGLALNEHLRFFTESGGVGVKYDDYVDLAILGADPNSQLASECNRSYTAATVAQCGARDRFSVIIHCGVPKYTASKSCDFGVATSGKDKIYLMFYVSDAWPADVEGVLSNVQICR